MEHHLELGEANSAAAKPCLPARHKCHTCERTRSVKMRVLSWILGKFSLMLVIILTSATTTFLYHKLLPDDVPSSSSSSSSLSSSSSPRPPDGQRSEVHADTAFTSGDTAGGQFVADGQDHPAFHRRQMDALPVQSSSVTAARLGLQHLSSDAHYLSMTEDQSQYFTSGHMRLQDGALLIQRTTTLFLSADVILNSMTSPEDSVGPSRVIICLSLGRGYNSQPKPISCQLTYLRERDQQMARVWMLFQAQAQDRIYVSCSWPSFVISDNKDNQRSVFTAFDVGHV